MPTKKPPILIHGPEDSEEGEGKLLVLALSYLVPQGAEALPLPEKLRELSMEEVARLPPHAIELLMELRRAGLRPKCLVAKEG